MNNHSHKNSYKNNNTKKENLTFKKNSNPNNDDNSIKIAKAISSNGYCSRRDAERLVLENRVKVNGALIDSPAVRVFEKDTITIDGVAINKNNKPRIWLYYKPVGVVTTHKDPQGRETVLSILQKLLNLNHIICVGRLDISSEGLIVVTNNGDIANELMLPKNNYSRTYKARVYGRLELDEIKKRVSGGIEIDGVNYREPQIKLINKSINSWLEIKIFEGKNREVRKIFEYFGLEVSRLIRTHYADFSLGNLEPNEIIEIDIRDYDICSKLV